MCHFITNILLCKCLKFLNKAFCSVEQFLIFCRIILSWGYMTYVTPQFPSKVQFSVYYCFSCRMQLCIRDLPKSLIKISKKKYHFDAKTSSVKLFLTSLLGYRLYLDSVSSKSLIYDEREWTTKENKNIISRFSPILNTRDEFGIFFSELKRKNSKSKFTRTLNIVCRIRTSPKHCPTSPSELETLSAERENMH